MKNFFSILLLPFGAVIYALVLLIEMMLVSAATVEYFIKRLIRKE